MKAKRLILAVVCCVAATSASAQSARSTYVVPAPCPYPYGCDVNGNPYAPPAGVYMNAQPNYGAMAMPVSIAVQSMSGGRHGGGISVVASVLSSPTALNVIGNLLFGNGR
jgi:hypothetical protein